MWKFLLGLVIGIGFTVVVLVWSGPFYFDPSNRRILEEKLQNKVIFVAGIDHSLGEEAWSLTRGPDSGYYYSIVLSVPDKESVEKVKEYLNDIPLKKLTLKDQKE